MNTMQDIPNMTVREHHLLCLGVLAQCFNFLPARGKLQKAVYEAVAAAKAMGQDVDPQRLWDGEALSPSGPKEN